MHSILEILDEDPDSAGPDLVSLDDLKLALGITGTDEDAALQASITFQSRIIAEYCDRRFGLADALESFTFDRGETMQTRQALTLSLYPVVEVTDVSAAAGGYDFDPATGRLWLEGCGTGVVAVTYSGGYDLPERAPARLAQAVIQSVNDVRSAAARDPKVSEVQHGETRIAYFSSRAVTAAGAGYLSESVVDLIKTFRRLHAT